MPTRVKKRGSMKLFAPKYYERFRCIGGECTKNCCIGWEIDIDEDTARKYEALDGEEGMRIRGSISDEGDCPHFKLCDGERCANLREDNLCSVIAEYGEEMIPEICREHPRFYNVQPDRCEVGVGLACPTAAQLILSSDDHGVYKIGEIDIAEDDGDIAEYRTCRAFLDAVCDFGKVASVRGIIAFANYHSSVTLSDLLFKLCTSKSKEAVGKDYFLSRPIKRLTYSPESEEAEAVISLICSLETLDDGYSERLKEAISNTLSDRERMREFVTDNRESFFSLFQYFLYRHLMDGAEDGSVHPRVQFAAISAYTVLALSLYSGGAATILEEAVDYSRNIEYSNENLYSFIDGAEGDCNFGIGFILAILGAQDTDC